MNTKIKKLAVIMILMPCLAGIAAAQSAPSGKVIVEDSFATKTVNGGFVLTAPNQTKYAGVQTRLRLSDFSITSGRLPE
ncbi:MAG: hypothetical protein WC661_19185 [Opitutaceae bacterium]